MLKKYESNCLDLIYYRYTGSDILDVMILA